jgi:hypothetical protein
MSKWVNRWNILGSTGNHHIVAQATDGTYGCSCPVWKFKRQECKHIRYVKNNLCTPNRAGYIDINNYGRIVDPDRPQFNLPTDRPETTPTERRPRPAPQQPKLHISLPEIPKPLPKPLDEFEGGRRKVKINVK